MNNSEASYKDLKNQLLKHIGPSADELANIVHGGGNNEFFNKKESEKLQHAKFIAERYFLGVPQEDNRNIHHMAVRLYKFHCHKKFAHTIKLSKTQTFAELLELTSSFDSQLDFDRTKSDKPNNMYRRPFQKRTFCEYCRKPGHQEADCFKKQNSNKHDFGKSQKYKSPNQDDKTQTTHTTKYHKPTHKDAGIKIRPATVNWSQTSDTVNSIKGIVNGHDADIVIDTGAQITVVPGKFIYSDNLTGDTVSILGINGNPMLYQTAYIPITLRNRTVHETVAVAPEHQLNAKVLLSAPIDKVTTQNLLDSYFNKQKQQQDKQVHVATRSATVPQQAIKYYPEQDNNSGEDDRASDLSYDPNSETDFSDSDKTDVDITSEEESQGQSHAPSDKYLNQPPLSSQPVQTLNQTLPTEPQSSITLTEPYSSNPSNHKPFTEPYSSNPSNYKPFTEPYSSNPSTEPYSSTSLSEPNSSTSLTEPISSTILTEPKGSNIINSHNKEEPYSSHHSTEPYSSRPNAHNPTNTSDDQPVHIPNLPVIDK